MVGAVIPAAGQGQRMGKKKQFLPLLGKPLLFWTLKAFEKCAAVDCLVLVVNVEEMSKAVEMIQKENLKKVVTVVEGGRRRQDSVVKGFEALPEAVEVVVIHDGARPLIKPDIITRSVKDLSFFDGLVVAVPAVDTLKEVSQGLVMRTLERRFIWQAQTPQVFKKRVLTRVFRVVERENLEFTDEATAVETLGYKVGVMLGDYTNFKITTPLDLFLAEAVLRERCESE